jgi:hypothetical protein
VAGSDVQNVAIALKRLDEAIAYLRDNMNMDGCVWENLTYDILVETIRPEIAKIRRYGDRLSPDNQLCDILNSEYFRGI